jgi:hypothetical protein
MREASGMAGRTPFSYLEVGTHDGVRACQVIEHFLAASAALGVAASVRYYGFDLFEELDDETAALEFAKSRRPPPRDEVLAAMRRRCPSAKIKLFRGNTRRTLPAARLPVMDLVFVDGGHSEETTASDWENVRRFVAPWTTVLFDDFLLSDTGGPDLSLGCAFTVLSLDPKGWTVEELEPVDYYPNTGVHTRMARVRMKR